MPEEPYLPTYLTPAQAEELDRQTLVQVEAALHSAWLNLVLAQSNYAGTLAQLQALEADVKRRTPQESAP